MSETKFNVKSAIKNIYLNIFFWSFWSFILFFLLCLFIPTRVHRDYNSLSSYLFALDTTHIILLVLSILFLMVTFLVRVVYKSKMESNDMYYLIFVMCSISTVIFFLGIVCFAFFWFITLKTGYIHEHLVVLYLILSFIFLVSTIIIAYFVRHKVTYSFYLFWMIIFVIGCVGCAIFALGVPVLILFLPNKYPLGTVVHQHKENLKNNKVELQKWEKLHKDGVITNEEFKMQKAALE